MNVVPTVRSLYRLRRRSVEEASSSLRKGRLCFLGDDVQGAGEICGQRRHVGGMSNLTVADRIANILDLGDRAFMFESGMRRGYAEVVSVTPTRHVYAWL